MPDQPVYVITGTLEHPCGASEQQLRNIAAVGLGEAYFRDGGRRAHGLEVEFADVEHVEFDL